MNGLSKQEVAERRLALRPSDQVVVDGQVAKGRAEWLERFLDIERVPMGLGSD